MHDPPEAPEGFLSAVRDAVGPAHCLTDPDLKAGYEVDWTRRFRGPALLVARPADTAEVAKVLVVCARYHVPVVPQGGNTGLVGGSVPRGGEAVVSLGRLNRVLHCDADDGLLLAQAGTTLAVAHAAAGRVGSELGIDIAARDSATLGGMVATNAGGVHVVRYGPMRSRLAGIEVVLADGTVASRLSGLVKDNVGYDLAQLMAGSEGTLGVVTKVVLRLVPVPEYRVAALVALRGGAGGGDPGSGGGDAVTAVTAVTAVRSRVGGPVAPAGRRSRRPRARVRRRDEARPRRERPTRPAGSGSRSLAPRRGVRGAGPKCDACRCDRGRSRSHVDRRRRRRRRAGAPVELPGTPHGGDRDPRGGSQAGRHLAAVLAG